ncbi:hypothetical protein [Bacteroides sedimenti]
MKDKAEDAMVARQDDIEKKLALFLKGQRRCSMLSIKRLYDEAY